MEIFGKSDPALTTKIAPNTSPKEQASRMTDDLRPSFESPPAKGSAGSSHPLTATLPIGAFTASVLFDVLALVAENPDEAHSYQRGAADLLTFGLSTVLASVALDLVDALLAPVTSANSDAGRPFAINGAVIAIYLLDVAARRKQLADARAHLSLVDTAPIGLSLLGLTLLGVSAKR